MTADEVVAAMETMWQRRRRFAAGEFDRDDLRAIIEAGMAMHEKLRGVIGGGDARAAWDRALKEATE